MKTTLQFPGSSSLEKLVVSILLGFALTATASASGIDNFGMAKAKLFIQEDPNSPAPAPEMGFLFVASFEIDDPGDSASGTVTLPDGTTHSLARVPTTPNFHHAEIFDTEEELHAAYPFGTYTFSLTVDGVAHTATLNLTQTPFPEGPHVLNFDDLQAVDPNESFVVEWAPFAEGTADDFISLEIGEFRTPEPGESGSLNGTDTSTVIEAGTLDEATTYESNLEFGLIVDRNPSAISGALGAGVIGSWTHFETTTTGGGNGAFAITTASLPNAVLDQPYSATFEASEPVAAWGADHDALPDGIELNTATGELSGTPSQTGSFTFEVTAVSATYTEFDTREFTLTVGSGETRPAVPELEAPSMEDGVFSLVIQSPGGDAVQIEISDDLREWTPLTVAEPVNGVITFEDDDTENHRLRFYRVRWQ